MKGNTLGQFIDDLLTAGGPEKEFLFQGKKYLLECQPYKKNLNLIEMVIFECFGNGNYIFRCHGRSFTECVEQFEQAHIFDGKTIYEAENEIEVLYG